METINGLPADVHQIIDYLSTSFAAPEISVLLTRADLYNDLVVIYLELKQKDKCKKSIKDLDFIFVCLKRKLIDQHGRMINEKKAEAKLRQNLKEFFPGGFTNILI